MKSKVTIHDVAIEAGVSTQTVSRVVNDKGEISPQTRQAVLEVIDRMGYRPSNIARGLATSRTFTIGLVVPDIANPFFPEITRGIEDIAWQAGYGVLLSNTIEDPAREEAAMRSLEDKRVDGVIVCSARLDEDRLLPLLKAHREAVLINRTAPAEIAGSVCADDAFGASLAVKHLLSAGRSEIGFLAGPAASRSGKLRLEGSQRALREANLDFKPHLLAHCPPNPDGGYQAALGLLQSNPNINALMCYNDLVAIGALRACAELNRQVPDSVAIVGCDDTPLAGLVRPALTSVAVPKYEIGADAARMLIARIEGKETRDEIIHKPKLIIRDSTPKTGAS